ncbi:ribose-phosphate diphosphokinase [Anaplasma capra]|uniref:ribose-phosphate diphosphokinase n=1 Tax=Anaplasma capra TaxID=1562740 RepID=UPI0021D6069F|nr:ribose-phosphate diphosphokinase [Anaplasma capra]MCU7611788.1 ribose-phosphate diphosphokinase [Anaplasma capra]MCU7612631.1 ribose-phosphate diphosphokinase [Anaplasma capra]
MVIVPGGTAAVLAASLSSLTGLPTVTPCVSKFSDGEINVEFPTSVPRCKNVVLIQSLCSPVNDSLMELLLLADAVRRILVPDKIIAVVPYMCYSRQDRVTSRVAGELGVVASALSSKVVAKLFGASGIDHTITVDLHSSQAAGFFDMPLTNLPASGVFLDAISNSHMLEKLVVVAPDCGALGRVREFVGALSKECKSVQVAVIDKYRESPGVSEVMHVIGNVKDRHCLIMDDIVDSGGTLCNAAAALKTRGAASVHAYVTHGVLSRGAPNTIEASELDSLVITDTISGVRLQESKIRVQSVSKLIGDHILSRIA